METRPARAMRVPPAVNLSAYGIGWVAFTLLFVRFFEMSGRWRPAAHPEAGLSLFLEESLRRGSLWFAELWSPWGPWGFLFQPFGTGFAMEFRLLFAALLSLLASLLGLRLLGRLPLPAAILTLIWFLSLTDSLPAVALISLGLAFLSAPTTVSGKWGLIALRALLVASLAMVHAGFLWAALLFAILRGIQEARERQGVHASVLFALLSLFLLGLFWISSHQPLANLPLYFTDASRLWWHELANGPGGWSPVWTLGGTALTLLVAVLLSQSQLPLRRFLPKCGHPRHWGTALLAALIALGWFRSFQDDRSLWARSGGAFWENTRQLQHSFASKWEGIPLRPRSLSGTEPLPILSLVPSLATDLSIVLDGDTILFAQLFQGRVSFAPSTAIPRPLPSWLGDRENAFWRALPPGSQMLQKLRTAAPPATFPDSGGPPPLERPGWTLLLRERDLLLFEKRSAQAPEWNVADIRELESGQWINIPRETGLATLLRLTTDRESLLPKRFSRYPFLLSLRNSEGLMETHTLSGSQLEQGLVLYPFYRDLSSLLRRAAGLPVSEFNSVRIEALKENTGKGIILQWGKTALAEYSERDEATRFGLFRPGTLEWLRTLTRPGMREPLETQPGLHWTPAESWTMNLEAWEHENDSVLRSRLRRFGSPPPSPHPLRISAIPLNQPGHLAIDYQWSGEAGWLVIPVAIPAIGARLRLERIDEMGSPVPSGQIQLPSADTWQGATIFLPSGEGGTVRIHLSWERGLREVQALGQPVLLQPGTSRSSP